jgi:hypothetical protein
MALSKIDAANFLTGTIPQGNVANASLNAVTSLPAGVGGKVLQVVQDVFSTESGTTSTSYVAVSGFAATITPSSTSSKILVLCSASGYINTSNAYLGTIYRGTTSLGDFGRLYSQGSALGGILTFNYLDSPSTTSATTYTYYHKVASGTGYVSVNNYTSVLTLMEISA